MTDKQQKELIALLKEENAALQKVCHEQQAELETLRMGYNAPWFARKDPNSLDNAGAVR